MATMISHSPRDTLANRLIVLGCLLLLAPCLLAVLGAAIFGWPLALSFLPQKLRPIGVAQPGEVLVLVAGLEGTSGTDPSERIAEAMQDGVKSATYQIGSSTRIRTGWLDDIPLSDEDARQLGQPYNATIVIWGKYDSSSNYQVTCSILRPTDSLEPRQFTLTLPQGDEAARDDLATLVLSVALYYNNDAYNASLIQPMLGNNLDPTITTLYRFEIYRENGDPTNALATVDTALSSDPKNAQLLALKASALLDLFQYDEALDAISASIEQEPNRAETYLVRGTIYQRMDDAQSALADYNQVLDLAPDHADALRARAQINQMLGDTQAALADYAALMVLEPENYQNFLARAGLYTADGDKTAALDDFEQALARAEKSDEAGFDYTAQTRVLETRARAFRSFGEYNQALDDYNQLVGLNMVGDLYQLERGMTYWEMGDQAKAQDEWDGYLQFSGNAQDAMGYNNLAWELAMLEYYEPALEYSNQSLKLGPSDANSLHTQGYIHLGLKEYQAALEDFEKAMKNNLSYTPIYRDIADAYFGLGRYEQAIDNYRTYLHLATDAIDRYEVEKRLAAALAAFQP